MDRARSPSEAVPKRTALASTGTVGAFQEAVMKTVILARVVAKPINFPDEIEVLYHCLDESQTYIGKSYRGEHSTWEKVRRRFKIGGEAAKKCEWYLRKGGGAFLGNREVSPVAFRGLC